MLSSHVESIRNALQCQQTDCSCRHGTLVHCPAHNDEKPSLSLAEKDGKILVKCFAGCSQEAVIAELKRRGLWPERERRRTRVSSNGHVLTVRELAEAKKLPADFLRELGLRDTQHGVKIPYFDADGQPVAVRYRLALHGERRFVWRKGSKASLYGLWRLAEARERGFVVVVEGESDCWTLWLHGVLALGIPGKSTWKSEWQAYLDGIERIYLWIEPDADDFAERIGRDVPHAKLIFATDSGFKDISDAHVAGADVPAMLEQLMAKAVPFTEWQARQQARELDVLEQQALSVLIYADPLELVEREIRRAGWGGDPAPVLKAYVAATTRLLEQRPGAMSCHAAITGPAGGGKSTAVHIVQSLLPNDAVVVIPAGSPRVLVYHEADFKHKLLLVEEIDTLPTATTDDENPLASAIRQLLQDGELTYDVVERDESGKFSVRHIRKEGPTCLLVTAVKLPPSYSQFGSRVLEIAIPEGRDPIKAALAAIAAQERDAEPWQPSPALVAFQALLQCQAPWRVVVPFAPQLAEGFADNTLEPRAARDFRRLLSLIKAVAVLRHRTRRRDSAGRVVAEVSDYETVYQLFWRDYDAATGVTETVLQVITAVEQLRSGRVVPRVTIADVARRTGLPYTSAERAVKRALANGWLVNNAKRGYDLTVGDDVPPATSLPLPEWVHDTFADATGQEEEEEPAWITL